MRPKSDCPTCERASGLPLGRGFSRRRFLQLAGTGLVASYFADVVDPSLLYGATTAAGATLQNSARNCIFVFLAGAPSQVDMWDLKEGPWTPSDVAPTSYGDVRWPQGLLPKTAEHLSKLVIVRSGLSWVAVHPLGQVWMQVARNPAGLSGSIAPHIGAVVALESQSRRTASDVLPAFLAINAGAIPGSGYFPAKYGPCGVYPYEEGLATLTHPEGAERFSRRWNLLHRLDANRSSGALGKAGADINDFFDQAKLLVDQPALNDNFRFDDTEHRRYGGSTFGDSLIVARNLIRARKGVRFVQVTLDGWDHHAYIYTRGTGESLYTKCDQLDSALAPLLTDLSTIPGADPSKTLLDETLIVIASEFGRTVGPLNSQSGRDHYLRNTFVFAGGGVRGGRIIGQTNALGDQVTEYGWSANRDVRPEDVTCTIYSALGIDYTTLRTDDPLGRGFEYVPFAKDGVYRVVAELF
jgi:uncharacterized protein DUF1501